MKPDNASSSQRSKSASRRISRSSALTGRSIPVVLFVMAVLTGALIVFAAAVLLGVVHY